MLRKIVSISLATLLMIGVFAPTVSEAYYVDSAQSTVKIKPGETLMLNSLQAMNEQVSFTGELSAPYYSVTTMLPNFSVRGESSVNKSTSPTFTLNSQAGDYVSIKNESTTDFLHVNLSNYVLNTDYSFAEPAKQEGTYTYVPVEAVSTGSAEINSGELSLSLANNTFSFPGVVLDGSAKSISATLPNATILDATGTAAGWRVVVSATPFKEKTPVGGFKSGTSAKLFTTEAFTISPGSIVGLDGSSITGITLNSVRQNLKNTDVVLASAAVGSGIGKYDLTFGPDALQLEILNSKPYVDKVNYPTTGTPYETNLKWSIIAGP